MVKISSAILVLFITSAFAKLQCTSSEGEYFQKLTNSQDLMGSRGSYLIYLKESGNYLSRGGVLFIKTHPGQYTGSNGLILVCRNRSTL